MHKDKPNSAKTKKTSGLGLTYLAGILSKELLEIEEYLGQTATGTEDHERHADPNDEATRVIFHNISGELIKRHVQKLHKLNEALDRIADGTFGICEECNNGIGLKRLEAMPLTTLCIDCAETLGPQKPK